MVRQGRAVEVAQRYADALADALTLETAGEYQFFGGGAGDHGGGGDGGGGGGW